MGFWGRAPGRSEGVGRGPVSGSSKRSLQAGTQEVRRLDLLVRVHRAGRPLMKHEIARAMADWEASPRTLFRDVDWLVAHGFLERVGEAHYRYPVGRWPAVRLTAAEWTWVSRVVRAAAERHPENERIRKALHILESALRVSSPPASPEERTRP